MSLRYAPVNVSRWPHLCGTNSSTQAHIRTRILSAKTLNLQPETRNPKPPILIPTPSTRNHTLNPKPQAPNPEPYPSPLCLIPTPSILNPEAVSLISQVMSGNGKNQLPELPMWGESDQMGWNPTPYTLHPTPYTLHPTPYTLHPTSYTLHPTPYTLHPTPCTLHPAPCILHPAPYTPHPTPHTLNPTPYTLHPTPFTLHPNNVGGADGPRQRRRLVVRIVCGVSLGR